MPGDSAYVTMSLQSDGPLSAHDEKESAKPNLDGYVPGYDNPSEITHLDLI